MKKRNLILSAICVVSAATIFMQRIRSVDTLTDLQKENIEALSSEEEDDWRSGYTYGSKDIGGAVIPCCLRSPYGANACNYGKVGCIEII